jgi:tetratricopeptide (TPR) repeat protein
MSDDSSPVGRIVRARRLAAGLSQEELAAAAELSVRAIGDIERGRARWPYQDSLRRLADALDIQDQRRAEFFAAGRRRSTAAAAAPAEPAGLHSGAIVPRQLPAPVRHFAGRERELTELSRLLEEAGDACGRSAVVISAIGGLAGIGKTALALEFAWQIAGSFPDGQLHVNLRGYDPVLPPMPAADAVRLFLDALQVPVGQIPATAEAQAGMYRSVLAGKKVLIVADNAADAAQVRPLLPGSAGSLVIVTSRSRLAGLVATDGAAPLSLDVLTDLEAGDLLARILGGARVAAEPEASRQLVELCGRLPLALAIAAARAATQPELPLAALASELAGAAGRLDALQADDDPLASVRAALKCSYDHLSADAARMLRLLSVHPGPGISAPAAASLTGLPGAEAGRHLAELADASLISGDGAGRYGLHDLVRLFAAEQIRRHDSDAGREAASARMLDHYLHTGVAAALLLSPGRAPVAVDPASPGTAPEHLADDRAALSWFEAEHQVLLAAAGHAFAAGHDARAWTIAWMLQDYLTYRGYWHDQLAVSTTALAAAVRLGDLGLQAKSHYYLAQAAAWLGRYDDAKTCYGNALELARQLGEPAWQAQMHLGLASAHSHRGHYALAADSAREAFGLFPPVGHEAGQATALNSLGWNLGQLGDHEHSLAHCQQAVALSRKIGGQVQCQALDSLGYARHRLGQHAEAITCYQQALDIARQTGHRYQQAESLGHLGDTYQASGAHEAACTAWRAALAILNDMQHPDAAKIRNRLETGPAAS